MKKLIIADDEHIIRKGLRKSLDWESLEIEIVGEAEDGSIAYKKAIELQPDIMLVDINMPHLNGLKLIEKLKDELPNCEIIIVTGYDEFEYAKQAVKLGVFDYILKPVNKRELLETITNLLENFDKKNKRDKYISWAEEQIETGKKDILRSFFESWVKKGILQEDMRDHFEILGIHDDEPLGIVLIKALDVIQEGFNEFQIESELLSFCIQNIIEELLEEIPNKICFEDHNQLIVVIFTVDNEEKINEISELIKEKILVFLSRHIIIEGMLIGNNLLNIPDNYEELKDKINTSLSYTPIVLLAKNYIDKYYYKQDLSLQMIADKVEISSAYLSKLIKKEMGFTFKEYLTKIRIDKAILFMKNPTVKMYEIAERVGYNTQHYFSAAFKKEIGISPNDYKNKR